ncbi:MAG: serine hydrolase [Planctomycetota bacterium]
MVVNLLRVHSVVLARLSAVVALCVLGLTSPVLAQQGFRIITTDEGADFAIEHDSWRRSIPETPTGLRLERFIMAINGDASLADTRTGEDVFAPELLEHQTYAQLQGHLQFVQQRTGGVDLIRILKAEDHLIRAELQPRNGGTPWMAYITIRSELPLLVTAMSAQPMQARPEGAPRLDEFAELDEALASVPDDVGFAMYRLSRDGTMDEVHRSNADTPFNVNQFARLFVLGSIIQGVEMSELDWDDTVKITREHLSLHQGETRQLGVGSRIPLHRLARAMLSSDDLKATDALISVVGRDVVEEYMSLRTTPHTGSLPFLTAREHVAMKLWGSEELRDAYAAASENERRILLSEDVAIVRDPGDSAQRLLAWERPRHVGEIGWFCSADDACFVMNELWMASVMEKQIARHDDKTAHLWDVLTMNDEIPAKAPLWPQRGFFGGTEPGALSLAWMVERFDGERYAIVLLANNDGAPIDTARYVKLIYAVFELLSLEL